MPPPLISRSPDLTRLLLTKGRHDRRRSNAKSLSVVLFSIVTHRVRAVFDSRRPRSAATAERKLFRHNRFVKQTKKKRRNRKNVITIALRARGKSRFLFFKFHEIISETIIIIKTDPRPTSRRRLTRARKFGEKYYYRCGYALRTCAIT